MSPLAGLSHAALLGAWLLLSVHALVPACEGGQCGPANAEDADGLGLLQHRREDTAAALNATSEGSRCCYGACPTSGTGNCNGPDHWCSKSKKRCEQRCDSSASGGAKAVYCPRKPKPPGGRCCYGACPTSGAGNCNAADDWCSLSVENCEQHCDSSTSGGAKALYCPQEPRPPVGRCCYGMASCPDAPVSTEVPGCNPVEHFCSLSADLCEHACDSSAHGGAKARFCPLRPTPRACMDVPDADPMELAVLSGDVSAASTVIPEMLAKLGWSRGPRAVDPANLPGEFDIAQVYFKGCEGDRCDYCAVAFSATDDNTDVLQAGNVTPVDFCGAPNVRGGYVQEMRGFYADPNFTMVREALTAKGCCRVYTTGHSLGGALAQLFAFCANQQGSRGSRDETIFAGISDNVSLVTFGAVRLSEEPLYNGVPGRCFDGARYSIDDAEAAPPPPALETQLLALELFAQTMLLMNETAQAEHLESVVASIGTALDNGQDAQAKQMIDVTVASLYDFYQGVGFAILTQAPLPWVPAATQAWFTFTASHRDEFQFVYDVVPGLYAALKFPSVAYRPLQHPESGVPAPPRPRRRTCGTTAPDVPQYNPLQLSFGMLGYAFFEGAGWFPNHGLCCYIRALSDDPAVAGCGQTYFNASWGCRPPTWR